MKRILSLACSLVLIVGASNASIWAQCSCGDVGVGGIFDSCSSCSSGGCDDRCYYGDAYISAFGGWSNLSNILVERRVGTTQLPVDPADPSQGTFTQFDEELHLLDTKDDFAGGLAIGKYVHERCRVELEGSYFSNDVNSVMVQQWQRFSNIPGIIFPVSETTTPAVGTVDAISLMANGLLYLQPRCVGGFNIYGGGGIGIQFFDADIVAGATTYDFDQSAFAFQVIAGLDYNVRDRVDLFTEYRFMHSSKLSLYGNNTRLGEFDLDRNSLFFGIRFRR